MDIYKNTNLNNIDSEEWKDIVGYDGVYMVSNMGRVKSLSRMTPNGRHFPTIIKKQSFNRGGYLHVVLYGGSRSKTWTIHKLVGKHYLCNPENKKTINHKNGIKTDNRASELEWFTYKEQVIHAFKIGLNVMPKGIRRNRALSDEDVFFVFNSDKTNTELANIYSLDQTTISNIKTGRNWSSLTGKKYNRMNRDISMEDISEILKSKSPFGGISEKLNISKSVISNIRMGWSHNHLTGLPKKSSKKNKW